MAAGAVVAGGGAAKPRCGKDANKKLTPFPSHRPTRWGDQRFSANGAATGRTGGFSYSPIAIKAKVCANL
ncbi:MAG TPA: hypothetical protein VMR98_04125 [Candidatus Polarisedimenticolaceae bacterium]|nr:hypothetical protein [Candidatus Polarisedimenticolaceae bacterium]